MSKKARSRKATVNGSDAAGAYDLIMDAIVTQKLAPSQKVSENVLTEMFAISRTTARNVMEQLTAQQFLISISPRITRVAPLTLQDVKQNFAMRRMIQPNIFAIAAPQLDYDEVVKLNEATSHKGPITDNKTALRLLKANKEFNLYVAQRVKYPLLIHWVRQLEDTTMRIYWLYVKMMESLPYTWEHQRDLVECMKNDRADDIQEQTHRILAMCEERVLNSMFAHATLNTQDLRLPG